MINSTFDMVKVFHAAFSVEVSERLLEFTEMERTENLGLFCTLVDTEEHLKKLAADMKQVGQSAKQLGKKELSMRALRISLMAEEFAEYLHAEQNDDCVEIADALGDIGVITEGTAHVYGIPYDDVRLEIQISNMSKLGKDGKPIIDDRGKVQKGSNYQPPNIKRLLHKL